MTSSRRAFEAAQLIRLTSASMRHRAWGEACVEDGGCEREKEKKERRRNEAGLAAYIHVHVHGGHVLTRSPGPCAASPAEAKVDAARALPVTSLHATRTLNLHLHHRTLVATLVRAASEGCKRVLDIAASRI